MKRNKLIWSDSRYPAAQKQKVKMDDIPRLPRDLIGHF